MYEREAEAYRESLAAQQRLGIGAGLDECQLALDIPEANYEGININSTPREGRNAPMFTHLTPPPLTPGNLFTGYPLQRNFSAINMPQKLNEIYNERTQFLGSGEDFMAMRSNNRLPSPTANSGFKSYIP